MDLFLPYMVFSLQRDFVTRTAREKSNFLKNEILLNISAICSNIIINRCKTVELFSDRLNKHTCHPGIHIILKILLLPVCKHAFKILPHNLLIDILMLVPNLLNTAA